jgi:16S rRNA (adenine1518-N6/adenine1519-N6)-dimethyltransferase
MRPDEPEGGDRSAGQRGAADVPGGDAAGPPASPSGLRQISLARLAEFGVEPKRDLGQNFLIDDNILGVILGQLECGPDDVVLEVGAGLGVLTAALAGEASQVHAFEIDKSLGPALAATLAGRPNVLLHFEDVLKASLERLDPAPTLCASNLPYSVAGPFVIQALQRLPRVRRYCLMVQREVADRMAAGPGTKVYGTLSVWVGLYTRIVRVRQLSRTIFYPQPHVDSTLIVLERRGQDELAATDEALLREVIQAAFGQRRKTLVNALSAGLNVSREWGAGAVAALGLSPDVRAERLEPVHFVRLAEELQRLRFSGSVVRGE